MTDYPMPVAPSGVDEAAWLAAVSFVRGYCEWHIAPEVEDDVLTLDGPGGRLLMLPTQRVSAVTSITNDGRSVSDPEWSSNGMVRGRWSCKFRGITATITHGYQTWPDELTRLLKEVALMASSGGASQVTSGSHQVSFETLLTDDQRATLDRYKLQDIP